jgi:hypothetical protein
MRWCWGVLGRGLVLVLALEQRRQLSLKIVDHYMDHL